MPTVASTAIMNHSCYQSDQTGRVEDITRIDTTITDFVARVFHLHYRAIKTAGIGRIDNKPLESNLKKQTDPSFALVLTESGLPQYNNQWPLAWMEVTNILASTMTIYP